MTDLRFDTHKIRRAFNRAAAGFNAAAAVPSEIRSRALERLQLLREKPETILDLGAGTGAARAWFKEHLPNARVLEIDSAIEMLRQTSKSDRSWLKLFEGRRKAIVGEATALPIRSESVDWVFSNLMLPWCAPLDPVLLEVARVIKRGGVFSFTSLGPDTLIELRNAWRHVDSDSHVLPFLDMHDVGDALVRAGFADPVLDVERLTVTYAGLPALLSELRHLGSSNALSDRPRRIYSRRDLQTLQNAYTRSDDRFPATIEVVFGQAWRSTREKRAPADETRVPISSIGRRAR